MTTSDRSSALSGIRVLDLSRVLAGPWATQILADLGAEIIKIEKPGSGDDTRGWGPPWLKDADGRDTRESAYFLSANRNKKSVTLDFTKPEGRKLARELAALSDIFIENFKPGGLKKYGLDYASLKTLNPRLVYCSITGFGQGGPLAGRPGYDFMIQGMSGLMSITGAPDGVAGGEPQKVGVALVDVMTGLYAAIGLLAALQQRQVTGAGQYIDVALFDCAVACLANQSLNFLVSGMAPQRMGNAHPNIVPYQAFATADGHIILAIGNDAQFRRFCTLAGETSLGTDMRFATNASRVANRHELVPIIASMLRKRSTADWLAGLDAAGIPCGPINDIGQAFAEPQAKARGLAIATAHASGTDAPGVRNPLRMPGLVEQGAAAPPVLGQHTDAVLRDLLEKSEEEIASLRAGAVI
jgi:crotonobetainyl-CoA:carnitine CoA-transferase CaiB-like acyl-CoA transferase